MLAPQNKQWSETVLIRSSKSSLCSLLWKVPHDYDSNNIDSKQYLQKNHPLS